MAKCPECGFDESLESDLAKRDMDDAIQKASQEAARLREALERLLGGAVLNKAGQICVHENAYKAARAALKEGAPNER